MKNKIILTFLSAVLLSVTASGCSGSGDSLPEDTPYNHCEKFSIMETEQGFYTNINGFASNGINLKFTEKGTNKQVYLCAKPECMHDGGEMCTATYKNLYSMNSVLYDGAVYTLVIENINEAVSYGIYRSALDGSAITRVGSAFSVNNVKEENYGFQIESFIIHKGYAYVPYHLSFGGSAGFAGGGLARMNLADGNSEIIYSTESYYASTPQNLQSSGDFVYYDIYDTSSRNKGFYAYSITDGTTEKLDLDKERVFIAGERVFVTKSTVWGKISSGAGNPHDIYAVNKETGVKTVLMNVDKGQIHCDSPLPYKDMIIITLDSGVYVYSETGELISAVEALSTEAYGGSCTTLIFGDKLYLVEPNYEDNEASFFPVSYSYYSCPVEDILGGRGEWRSEYVYYV